MTRPVAVSEMTATSGPELGTIHDTGNVDCLVFPGVAGVGSLYACDNARYSK